MQMENRAKFQNGAITFPSCDVRRRVGVLCLPAITINILIVSSGCCNKNCMNYVVKLRGEDAMLADRKIPTGNSKAD